MKELKSKEIKNFENYIIYEDGTCKRKNSKKPINPEISKNGAYFYRVVDSNKKRKMLPIDLLVAESFIPNPNGYKEIIHIDGKNENNSVNNLKWVSDEEFIGSLDGEIWKDVLIEGFEGYYRASNLGRIYSKRKVIYNKDGSLNKTKPPKIMKTDVDHKGYERVTFNIPSLKLKNTFKVHRIIAKTFIPNPDNLPQVNHIDGDKSNNKVENLEWIDNLGNRRHNDVIGLTPKNSIPRKVTMIYPNTTKEIKSFYSIHEAGTYLHEELKLGSSLKTCREGIRKALKTNGRAYGYSWKED